jgi:Xaa-Pro aminopeptidase
MYQFPLSFFENNRKRLMDAAPEAVVILAAHARMQYSADMAYPFRQDSNFWYLTGLDVPDAWLIVDSKTQECTLLFDEQSDYAREWEGEHDYDAIASMSGITNFAYKSDLKQIIKRAEASGKKIGFLEPSDERLEPYGITTNPARRYLANALKEYVNHPIDMRMTLGRLRQVKQSVEIEAIQQAIDITATALEHIHDQINIIRSEKELERLLTAKFYELDADGHAYEPIIASGKNAAIIHYQENSSMLQKGQLILLDVGARYAKYAADISRTWSLKKPSKRQKDVFDAVVSLQQTAFSKLKAGIVLRDYQAEMEAEALRVRKLLGKDDAPFPHGFSHFLGLDVHDSGDYNAPLEVGCVLTVEPGFYFADESIGVRIEDNVRITENGIVSMSDNIPKMLYWD